MKLAYFANYFPSLTETFIYREVIELARRGIGVSVYSLRKPPLSSISLESLPLSSATHYLLPVAVSCLIRAHLRFFLGRPLRYAAALLKMVAGSHVRQADRIRSLMHFGEGVVLADRVRADGITHIHAHFASQSASVARVVHLLTGIPYSFTGHAHDVWSDRLLLPEKLKEASFAVTCSDMARRSLLAAAGRDASSKVHLVYHGLDVDNFPYGASREGRERNLVLSIGRLTAIKGFPDLISACALLRDRGTPVRCVILGEGEERGKLEELIESNGLSGQVLLAGAMRQEEVRAYYRRACVFALPCADSADGNRDGIPNVLMEAMASGLPVITTTNSGQAELIRHGVHGLLVPPHAPDELASAIVRVCEDEILWKRLAAAARTRIVEDFDNRRTIEPLVRLFQRHVFSDKTRLTAPVSREDKPATGMRGAARPHPMKKVLVFVQDVPGRGGSRFAKFIRHLPRFGYEPIVITAKVGRNGAGKAAEQPGGGARIYRTWFLRKSPFRVFSKFFNSWSLTVYFESLFFIPDLFVTWLPSALRKGYSLIRKERIEMVITSSPPESLHMIGLLLKRLTGIKWIADFQDLWTTKEIVYRPPTRLHDRIVKRLERMVYERSDRLIANTRGNGRVYEDRFGLDAKKIAVIPNGYDEAEKVTDRREARGDTPGELVIGYMGYFDKEGFPWQEFLLSMKRVNSALGARLRLHIAGHVSRSARLFIRKHDLEGQVVRFGDLPHAEAFQLIGKSDLLLVLMYETPYSKAIVPHKLYYYLAMSKPVLAVAEGAGEVADIIRSTDTGRTVSASRPGGVEQALREYYEEWKRSGSIRYEPRADRIEAYGYRRLTALLARTMDETLETRPIPTSGNGRRLRLLSGHLSRKPRNLEDSPPQDRSPLNPHA